MNPRYQEIDFTKGLLTIGMIFAHVIQFFGRGDSYTFFYFQLLTNLVSFPGFLFCFGFASWLAYFSKPCLPWRTVMRTALKCYIAFVISGVCFRVLYSKQAADWETLLRVALIQDIPGYSEFLLSFSAILLLAALVSPLIGAITLNGKRMVLVILVCLAVTYFRPPFYPEYPVIGTFVGGGFPIVPYAPFFLFGVFIARYKLRINSFAFAAAIVATASFLILSHISVPIPRFPPSAQWILFSLPAVYMYYGVGATFSILALKPLRNYINSVGQNVLLYLLLSNIAIFVLKGMDIISTLEYLKLLVPYLGIMAVIYFLQYISVDLKRSHDLLVKKG